MSALIGTETADKLAHVCAKERRKAAHGSSHFLILEGKVRVRSTMRHQSLEGKYSMKKDDAKTIMFRIMLDFLCADDWADILRANKSAEVLCVISDHLGLNERDREEVMNRFDGEMRGVFIKTPTLPGRNMEKEEAKTIMLAIMHDLLDADDWVDVLSIISEHLRLNKRDRDEVWNRFYGELRDAFINEPTFPGSQLAKNIAEAEQENRKRYQE
jgi:hypothetical protein